jgi:hypothetical protein
MEKKKKKPGRKEAATGKSSGRKQRNERFSQPARPAAAQQPQVPARTAPRKDILNEKDREILREVDRVIWNPSLLNKFKNDGKAQMPDGRAKKKIIK